jgi:hypothetical protein
MTVACKVSFLGVEEATNPRSSDSDAQHGEVIIDLL